MIQIVADLQPFQVAQKISVYQDNEEIETISSTIENLIPAIKGVKNKYSADSINLIGNTQYLTKFQKDLSTDFDITKINIIQR